ncbi:coagulation factor IX isoform X2 [Nematostella vectensis]|nr:coagulation factor IX isoform X2 [Nematostella vectensis]
MDKVFIFLLMAGLGLTDCSPIQGRERASGGRLDEEELKKYDVFPSSCGVPSLPITKASRAFPVPRRFRRVVGGDEAKAGQFPWQIALLFKRQQYCGGALVHERWVVTGAHCFNPYTSEDPRDWNVTLGEYNLAVNESFEQRRGVKSITVHEHYKSMWFEGITDTPPMFDIALIELDRPVVFNFHVQPICIMRPNISFKWNTACFISGWGHTRWNGSQPNVLNFVMVPLVSHATCNKPLSYNGTIHETALCAGYERGLKDSCEFDSGGPLACQKGGRYYAVGLVSWGDECARAHKFGVYSRMAKLTPWMVSKIAEKEMATKKAVRKG